MACLSASKYVSLAISQKIKWHGKESLRDKQESVSLRLQHRTRGKCRGTCYSTFATVPSPSRPSLPHPTHHYHQQCFHSAPRQQRSTWAGAAVTIPAGLERPAENALLKPMFWSNIGSPSGGQSWHRRGCSWQSNLESGVLWALKIFLRRGRKWARGYSNLNSPGNDNARSSSPTNQGPFVPSKHLKLPVPTAPPFQASPSLTRNMWQLLPDFSAPSSSSPLHFPPQVQEHHQDEDPAPPFPCTLAQATHGWASHLRPRPVRVGPRALVQQLFYTPTEFDKTPPTFSSLHINVFYKFNNHKGYNYQNTVNTNF